MELTRDERQALEKATLKERVERLEEYVDYLHQRESDRDLEEFNKSMDEISERSDKQCMLLIIFAMLLVWWMIWALITKLCL